MCPIRQLRMATGWGPITQDCGWLYKETCTRYDYMASLQPDLSPIEQVWAYLKQKLRRISFNSADELFERLQQEWLNIRNSTDR